MEGRELDVEEEIPDELFVPEHYSCSFGSCGRDPETVYWSQGKPYYLCDEHWEKIVSPDIKTEKAARTKLGIPMPVFRADQSPPKWERPAVIERPTVHSRAHDCAVPDCGEPPTVMVRNTHLCDKHWKATRSSDTERRWAVRDALGWSEEDMAKAAAEATKAKKRAGVVQPTREKDVKKEPKKAARKTTPKVVQEEKVKSGAGEFTMFENLFSSDDF